MDASAFCYWLNGYVELHGEPPTPDQWATIKEHLALVFTKVTTDRTKPCRERRRPIVLPETVYCSGSDMKLC